MTKRESSRQTSQNLEEKLDLLCAGGAADELIDDAFVDALMEWLGPAEPLSHEATHYAVTQLQAAMKDDAAVASIRRDHARATDEKTFGQVMNEVRTKAGWTLALVAQKIGGETTLVERLERDLVPIGQIAVPQWADILETFQVQLTEFSRLAQRTARAQQLQQKLGSAFARSKADPKSAQHGRDLAFAIANALPNLDPTSKHPSIDQKLLDGLAAELRARQRGDLLRG
jgi:hypothetical protein